MWKYVRDVKIFLKNTGWGNTCLQFQHFTDKIITVSSDDGIFPYKKFIICPSEIKFSKSIRRDLSGKFRYWYF